MSDPTLTRSIETHLGGHDFWDMTVLKSCIQGDPLISTVLVKVNGTGLDDLILTFEAPPAASEIPHIDGHIAANRLRVARKQKRAQIDASRNRILAAIEGHGIRTIDKIDEYDLFYLARSFGDPAITARYVLRVPPPEASRINQAALLPGGTTGRVA